MAARSMFPIPSMHFLSALFILSLRVATTQGFIANTPTTTLSTTASQYFNAHNFQLNAQTDSSTPENLRAEAESLREKAEKLRSEIEGNSVQTKPPTAAKVSTSSVATTEKDTIDDISSLSPWAIVPSGPKEDGDREFRLYADIGREEGTWMDPRWGASGKRIEFSLDIGLLSNKPASPEVAKKMVQDNTAGKSSPVFALDTAKYARLRDGFDRMECTGGAYRIDTDRNGRSTIRIVLEVEGTVRADQSYVYGDVSIPPGCLYFSLPVFGRGIDNLSIKEGVVSVRQVGWHTGWRREESRILGVFTAKPLAEATKRDGF